jgi:hypothetical protein
VEALLIRFIATLAIVTVLEIITLQRDHSAANNALLRLNREAPRWKVSLVRLVAAMSRGYGTQSRASLYRYYSVIQR